VGAKAEGASGEGIVSSRGELARASLGEGQQRGLHTWSLQLRGLQQRGEWEAEGAKEEGRVGRSKR
jgi:hypothetical protein